MSYRIKTVAGLIGVPRNTLIAWERRYGLVNPDRTASGHRRYSAEDVATLQVIVGLMGQGLRISEAVELVREGHGPETVLTDSGVFLVERLLTPLLAFDQDTAGRVWRSAEALSFETRIHDVVLPLLRQLGDGWAAGTVTVAQEHYGSDFLRRQLMAMLLGLDHGPVDGPRVVCACPDGEGHELGLMAAAVLLALRGFRIVWLGASVPQVDLLGVVRDRVPRAVCVAIVCAPDPGQVVAWAQDLRGALPESVRLIIGGSGTVDLAAAPAGVRFCPSLRDLVQDLSYLSA